MKPIVFADLDDTLFQTARKMSEDAVDERLASRATNGSHSYMTKAQASTVKWLLETTRLIPTTARSSEVLARTTLAFTDYKICSNGGAIITPDGAHDTMWADHVARISATHSDVFAALQDSVRVICANGPLRSWMVCEAGVPVYFVAKIGSRTDTVVLDEAESRCRLAAGNGLVFHRNGRNMSFTPPGLTKVDAVNEMIARIPDAHERPIWGMGDSLSDLPFMKQCQMAVVPTVSQITQTCLEA